ncbi:MAG: helix-turn-helix domain-containing protein [Armatimonadota bacterium]|nr:helix-turn-helix domain-containing protein [Armatimonadota bacterium]
MPNTSSGPALLHAEEAARLLGVSARQVYAWAAAGVIPAHAVVRVGRRLYFRRAALWAWATGPVQEDGDVVGR